MALYVNHLFANLPSTVFYICLCSTRKGRQLVVGFKNCSDWIHRLIYNELVFSFNVLKLSAVTGRSLYTKFFQRKYFALNFSVGKNTLRQTLQCTWKFQWKTLYFKVFGDAVQKYWQRFEYVFGYFARFEYRRNAQVYTSFLLSIHVLYVPRSCVHVRVYICMYACVFSCADSSIARLRFVVLFGFLCELLCHRLSNHAFNCVCLHLCCTIFLFSVTTNKFRTWWWCSAAKICSTTRKLGKKIYYAAMV